MDSRALAVGGWADVLPREVNVGWREAVAFIASDADARRSKADYNTGSITEHEGYLLWALVESLQSRVIVEVGTFIGTSTLCLAGPKAVEHVYTCDASNDCLLPDDVVTVFPKTSSRQMFKVLAKQGVKADLVFLDGVVPADELDLLASVCAPDVVFALHDYNYGPKIRKGGAVATVPRKGIGNANLLRHRWPSYRVWEPLDGTTLAVLAPVVLREAA